MGVYGECVEGEHVKVWIDGVMVECDEGVRPWGGCWVMYHCRRCTTVLIAHDHMLFGTDIAWSMEDAQSRRVRHGRSAFPSM
jgi:hypothetical protein